MFLSVGRSGGPGRPWNGSPSRGGRPCPNIESRITPRVRATILPVDGVKGEEKPERHTTDITTRQIWPANLDPPLHPKKPQNHSL